MKIKPQFHSQLFVKQINETEWELTADLVFESKVYQGMIVVPHGFRTDFASVPRVPLVYYAAGNTAHMAAVIHDYCYRKKICSKFKSDRIFLEAMKVCKIPVWRRQVMYWAVSLFGWKAYCN